MGSEAGGPAEFVGDTAEAEVRAERDERLGSGLGQADAVQTGQGMPRRDIETQPLTLEQMPAEDFPVRPRSGDAEFGLT